MFSGLYVYCVVNYYYNKQAIAIRRRRHTSNKTNRFMTEMVAYQRQQAKPERARTPNPTRLD